MRTLILADEGTDPSQHTHFEGDNIVVVPIEASKAGMRYDRMIVATHHHGDPVRERAVADWKLGLFPGGQFIDLYPKPFRRG